MTNNNLSDIDISEITTNFLSSVASEFKHLLSDYDFYISLFNLPNYYEDMTYSQIRNAFIRWLDKCWLDKRLFDKCLFDIRDTVYHMKIYHKKMGCCRYLCPSTRCNATPIFASMYSNAKNIY